ncbi:hypothetical protein [Pseudoalteromonas luteoviolacea]|uniref:Lipoprotein n=1 Tax=Pseudoalteromonas luteoviolacea NCIMB 1942 TaxID=1365253 RepID=A0A167BUH9_9GAMM|nr:hypothetical protein [Pseudoalteromonas luteoviolacea]KZN46916.1 hypothetical protein N482_10920 [Pseudoalteromonas luteoviolacea NCIMB 1942]
MTRSWLTTLAIALSVSACHSNDKVQPVPALLSETSPSVISELQQAIVTLKGGKPPTLAYNALTHSPQLIINAGGQSKLRENPALMTVELSQLPISAFELQIRDDLCVLYFSRADKFVPLQHAKCIRYKPD